MRNTIKVPEKTVKELVKRYGRWSGWMSRVEPQWVASSDPNCTYVQFTQEEQVTQILDQQEKIFGVRPSFYFVVFEKGGIWR